MGFRAFFLGAVTVAALLACSSDDSKPPVSEDPGTGGAAAGGGASTGTDGGLTLDSSVVGDGGDCSSATIMTSTVAQQTMQTDPPVQTGGTIVNGTYDLTADTLYQGANGIGTVSDVVTASTIVITGTSFQRVETQTNSSGTATPKNQAGTIQTSGINGVLSFSCPLSTTESFSFTVATDGSLTLLNLTTNDARTYRAR